MTNADYLFLLGGHDLEMLEIKQLLLANNYEVIDKNLAWGAKLSDYQDVFSETKTNVCIELTEDMLPPSQYLRIDHHNELAHLPASIEQLAKLLGIQLNRHQQLVAANDKGYIPAMQAIGASEAEIQHIRLLDRKAQGVSEADERLAEVSIAQHLTVVQGVAVVKSLTHKFSPITDRLYQQNLRHFIIYTQDNWVYYGKNAPELIRYFPEEVSEHKAYFGGKMDGAFFGCINRVFTKEKILSFLTKLDTISV